MASRLRGMTVLSSTIIPRYVVLASPVKGRSNGGITAPAS